MLLVSFIIKAQEFQNACEVIVGHSRDDVWLTESTVSKVTPCKKGIRAYHKKHGIPIDREDTSV